MKKSIKNLVLFFTAFCIYITIEVLFRGYSYPLMGCAAGLSVLIFGSLNNCISWDIPILIQSLIGSLVITFFELIIGLADKAFLHLNMWDYTNVPLNYKGIICVPFSLAWMGLAFIGIVIADAIEYYVIHEDTRPYYRSLSGKVLFKLPERECTKEV